MASNGDEQKGSLTIWAVAAVMRERSPRLELPQVANTMQSDEQAIRDLVKTWLVASKTGDLTTVLSLMDDDVVFMVPGKPPFGKEAFAASSKELKNVRIEGISDIQEIQVLDDWAWMRSHLKVTITHPSGATSMRSGYTLTILRKQRGGNWVIARDANMLTESKE
jgi:uncharacterized protein (TIGR02246 family)